MENPVLELPKELVEREVKAICKRYRTDPKEAENILQQHFRRQPDILKKILAKYPNEDVTRLSAYKKIIKHVRKHIYYHLRQYQPDQQKIEDLRKQLGQLMQNKFCTPVRQNKFCAPDSPQITQVINELLLTHISTRERINDYQAFYQEVFARIDPPRTILDIGCGIHPLSYPFEHPEYRPEVYVAVDNHPEVIEILTTFAPYVEPTHLIPVCADIAEANWMSYLEREIDLFDVAFMLKLIPVISRQQRNLLPKLAEVPARQMVITATTEAMTRKENIRKREERVLCDFIEMTDKKIMATFQIENEFGYMIGETGETQKM